MTEKNAALEAAKEIRRRDEQPEIRTLSTGVRVRLAPVGANLIRDAVVRIKDPSMPVVMDEDKGREIENPNDPGYLKALEEARLKRERAAIELIMLLGVELVDGLPEDDGWLKKLRYLERRGDFDLSEFDLDDELDLELLYKKYIFGNEDLILLATVSGIGRSEVQAAVDSFRGQEERVPD